MDIISNLSKLNLKLPGISIPGGNYQSVNIRGSIAFVAIQFPIKNGEYLYMGRLGTDFTTLEGYEAVELCTLNVLAQVHKKIGFENILGLNHIEICFRSNGNWDESPLIANGASDLFVKTLGKKGNHTRSIYGVDNLPSNFCVGLTTSFTIKL